jgi:hypothetical protein
MKLVDQFIDPNMATAARVRLRIAGIASHVDTMDPHNIQPSRSGETRIGLWVIDDEQHEDAIHVLTNPEHKPRRVYSLDEISKLEASAEKKPGVPRRPGDIALTLLLAGGLLALVVYTAVDFLRGL